MKKDRLFIIIMALVAANLGGWLIKTLVIMFEGHLFANLWLWGLVIIHITAIIGVLWLLQNERKRRRIEREAQSNSGSEESPDKEA